MYTPKIFKEHKSSLSPENLGLFRVFIGMKQLNIPKQDDLQRLGYIERMLHTVMSVSVLGILRNEYRGKFGLNDVLTENTKFFDDVEKGQKTIFLAMRANSYRSIFQVFRLAQAKELFGDKYSCYGAINDKTLLCDGLFTLERTDAINEKLSYKPTEPELEYARKKVNAKRIIADVIPRLIGSEANDKNFTDYLTREFRGLPQDVKDLCWNIVKAEGVAGTTTGSFTLDRIVGDRWGRGDEMANIEESLPLIRVFRLVQAESILQQLTGGVATAKDYSIINNNELSCDGDFRIGGANDQLTYDAPHAEVEYVKSLVKQNENNVKNSIDLKKFNQAP